jgi:hypothetical protein
MDFALFSAASLAYGFLASFFKALIGEHKNLQVLS